MNAKIVVTLLCIAVIITSTLLVTALVNQHTVSYRSSIQVTPLEETGGTEEVEELQETQESERLLPLAHITAEQAEAIARQAVDLSKVGSVTDVELENEEGNVVWAVEFTKNGFETDVKIDAGTGKVLIIEDDDSDSDDED